MSDRSATTLDGQTALTYAPGDSFEGASTATRSVTGMFSASTSLSYDGALLVGEAVQNGAAAGDNGSLTYDYDTGFLLKSTTLVSGSDTVTRAITRDADKLMSQEGPFAITPTSGLPTSVHGDGIQSRARIRPSTRTIQRTATAGGTQVYGLALTRDDTGRISRRVETVGEPAHTYDYTYTPDNFLASVQRDGALVEQYAYDVNGNRTSRRLPGGGTESSTYDARDRLRSAARPPMRSPPTAR